MRLVEIYRPEQWTGRKQNAVLLEVPNGLSLGTAEALWFRSGGDTSGLSFAGFLVAHHGCREVTVERWGINYYM